MTEWIEKVFYINLEHRKDRNQYCLNQLKSIGFQENQIERFNAIQFYLGGIGCTKSHIACIELAKERNYKHIMIVEDDIEFTNPSLIKQQIHQLFQDNISFDVCMLGLNLQSYSKINPYLCRVFEALTTTGYIVHQHYYDRLLNNFRDGLSYLEKDLNQYTTQIYYHSIDAHMKILQKLDQWICFHPLTVSQAQNPSNINGFDMNYGQKLLKSLIIDIRDV